MAEDQQKLPVVGYPRPHLPGAVGSANLLAAFAKAELLWGGQFVLLLVASNFVLTHSKPLTYPGSILTLIAYFATASGIAAVPILNIRASMRWAKLQASLLAFGAGLIVPFWYLLQVPPTVGFAGAFGSMLIYLAALDWSITKETGRYKSGLKRPFRKINIPELQKEVARRRNLESQPNLPPVPANLFLGPDPNVEQ